jgi:hypothetical protein
MEHRTNNLRLLTTQKNMVSTLQDNASGQKNDM